MQKKAIEMMRSQTDNNTQETIMREDKARDKRKMLMVWEGRKETTDITKGTRR